MTEKSPLLVYCSEKTDSNEMHIIEVINNDSNDHFIQHMILLAGLDLPSFPKNEYHDVKKWVTFHETPRGRFSLIFSSTSKAGFGYMAFSRYFLEEKYLEVFEEIKDVSPKIYQFEIERDYNIGLTAVNVRLMNGLYTATVYFSFTRFFDRIGDDSEIFEIGVDLNAIGTPGTGANFKKKIRSRFNPSMGKKTIEAIDTVIREIPRMLSDQLAIIGKQK